MPSIPGNEPVCDVTEAKKPKSKRKLFPQDPNVRVVNTITRPCVDTTGCTTSDQALELAGELHETQVCKLFTRSDLYIFITNNSYFT
jgi:hypothetical protein